MSFQTPPMPQGLLPLALPNDNGSIPQANNVLVRREANTVFLTFIQVGESNAASAQDERTAESVPVVKVAIPYERLAEFVAAMELPLCDANVLVVEGKDVEISAELYEVLRLDSEERGISLEQAYAEEMAARRGLEKIMPPSDVLAGMIERSGAPAYLANEVPGKCPF